MPRSVHDKRLSGSRPRIAVTVVTIVAMTLLFVSMGAFCPVASMSAYAANGSQSQPPAGAPTGTPEPVDVTIADLTATDTELDGVEVTFSGEAVGGTYRSERSGYEWVNLASEGSVIGVFMTDEDAESIPVFGSYGVTGSTVTVTGIYHIACDDGHAGELDVHADTVTVTQTGGPVQTDKAPMRRWIVAFLLVGLGLVLLAVNQRLHLKRS